MQRRRTIHDSASKRDGRVPIPEVSGPPVASINHAPAAIGFDAGREKSGQLHAARGRQGRAIIPCGSQQRDKGRHAYHHDGTLIYLSIAESDAEKYGGAHNAVNGRRQKTILLQEYRCYVLHTLPLCSRYTDIRVASISGCEERVTGEIVRFSNASSEEICVVRGSPPVTVADESAFPFANPLTSPNANPWRPRLVSVVTGENRSRVCRSRRTDSMGAAKRSTRRGREGATSASFGEKYTHARETGASR